MTFMARIAPVEYLHGATGITHERHGPGRSNEAWRRTKDGTTHLTFMLKGWNRDLFMQDTRRLSLHSVH